jgi:hypothetical protein
VWGYKDALLNQVLDAGGWNRPWDMSQIEDLPREVLDLAARD